MAEGRDVTERRGKEIGGEGRGGLFNVSGSGRQNASPRGTFFIDRDGK